MKKLCYVTISYSHIESYEHLYGIHRFYTHDPPTSSINILRDYLEASWHINYVDISQQEFFAFIRCREAWNLRNFCRPTRSPKKNIFSREYIASVSPFLSQTTLQLRIFACSAILNQIQRAFLFLLLTSIKTKNIKSFNKVKLTLNH